MSISELKEIIQQKIMQTNDEQLLAAIDTILTKSDPVFVISEKWQKEIESANEDVKKGNFYTLNDFEEKYNTWLKD
ncbi:MAG: hypothetical protein V4546_07515 [Bacteroidota bacterium]|uniref:Addiction module component n=1 Tax=Pedobacter cryotolerans TaxID=2571270 RepID=A0A4U1CAK4_9SPHI|nr:hypothetical protein [Pedobacter cryotolerans]TKC02995.1 hypothetical protein FA045_00050 [Pedobacter cryotolerans]